MTNTQPRLAVASTGAVVAPIGGAEKSTTVKASSDFITELSRPLFADILGL